MFCSRVFYGAIFHSCWIARELPTCLTVQFQFRPRIVQIDNYTVFVGVQSMCAKLLDRIRRSILVTHYSHRTLIPVCIERGDSFLFHDRPHPREMGKAEVEKLLTHLAGDDHLAVATQNQAL